MSNFQIENHRMGGLTILQSAIIDKLFAKNIYNEENVSNIDMITVQQFCTIECKRSIFMTIKQQFSDNGFDNFVQLNILKRV
ncbi:hypothetical protein GLOIN_2v1772369 [Rhizophagus irregularis DAOM 181602=DAOM 197198]|nr:hypothetical protein GLOIN_2v1772369 [Rhizophagus irregularis DAOM 181602=DAOM 197198]